MKNINETLPRKVIGLRKGEGSFIFIDLEQEKGAEVSLWVYMCDWTLRKEEIVVTSENIGDMSDLSGFFLGEMILIRKDEGSGKIKINFSTGVKLVLSNEEGFYSGDDDYFMIFFGDAWVAKYSEQNGFSVKRQ
ncbi:hypothetical protein [Pseudomonas sp. 5P_3.1_Bac2]|uniref:hypothetical protein n=1 Tax=Pseudomonas sp. 5P_3.1_Bac2 TaxID=2971617 RepID=UPI0021C65CC7|nr:hypothetical protein [Pseudomonas sp. 5P_3.1_Bac2]MCU1716873.1 hypothetical protein [Pseudomonas sp. 5P_3.1_Bac2]